MQIDSEIRAALIAYTTAHVTWKKIPDDGALVDPRQPWEGTIKAAAKRLRGQEHSKLLGLGKLLAGIKET
jgi:hypothetical protein